MLVWGHEKGPRMKGKRCTTEDKIRILREADGGQGRGCSSPRGDPGKFSKEEVFDQAGIRAWAMSFRWGLSILISQRL